MNKNCRLPRLPHSHPLPQPLLSARPPAIEGRGDARLRRTSLKKQRTFRLPSEQRKPAPELRSYLQTTHQPHKTPLSNIKTPWMPLLSSLIWLKYFPRRLPNLPASCPQFLRQRRQDEIKLEPHRLPHPQLARQEMDSRKKVLMKRMRRPANHSVEGG